MGQYRKVLAGYGAAGLSMTCWHRGVMRKTEGGGAAPATR